jgi:hypothetical protein
VGSVGAIGLVDPIGLFPKSPRAYPPILLLNRKKREKDVKMGKIFLNINTSQKKDSQNRALKCSILGIKYFEPGGMTTTIAQRLLEVACQFRALT